MFFGYFLNTKKVTPSADFVIGPAKAEAFLFSHTRLPFPPRPLLPFGRISPAAKPGWPVIGPAFWVCRAKSRAAFRCAKPPCAVVRFAAMASPPRTAVLPFPSRLRRAGAPTAKPRPLLPSGRISPAAKPGWPVIGPTGADVLPFPSRLRRAGAPTAKPRPLLPFGRISPAAKPGWPVVAPAGGNVLATPFSLRSNVAPRSHPGLASIPSAYVLFFGAFFGAKMPPPGHAFAFLPAGASFRFVSPRGRGVRHPYGSSSAAAFMVAAPVTYTLPAFLNAPDSSTTALVLPFATFTTRSATP